MAWTSIHAITQTLNKAIDYIENPEKTDEQILVTGYNVDPLTATLEFEMTAELARESRGNYTNTGGTNNLAYHMIQSFSPYDKITPEQAHEIGKQFADEFLQGKHEYVISTHVDKKQIHNHIIFNSVSFYDYKKIRTEPYKTSANLRKISDRLCEENNLYVVKNPKSKGKTHYEWEHVKNGTSWKVQIQKLIDETIKKSADFDNFKFKISEKGCEIDETGKHIKFRLQGQERFCRGKTIGEFYTKEKIIERIENPNFDILVQETKESYGQEILKKSYEPRLKNTKELANILLTIRKEKIETYDDFQSKAVILKSEISDTKKSIKEIENKTLQYKKVLNNLKIYHKYFPIYKKSIKQNPFLKSKFKNDYEGELKMFNQATASLKKVGVSTTVDVEKLKNLIEQQGKRILDLSEKTKNISERIRAISTAENAINEIQSFDKISSRSEEKNCDISFS